MERLNKTDFFFYLFMNMCVYTLLDYIYTFKVHIYAYTCTHIYIHAYVHVFITGVHSSLKQERGDSLQHSSCTVI